MTGRIRRVETVAVALIGAAAAVGSAVWAWLAGQRAAATSDAQVAIMGLTDLARALREEIARCRSECDQDITRLRSQVEQLRADLERSRD